MKPRKILSGKVYNPGNRVEIDKEPVLQDLPFKVYKFNNRIKPTDNRRIVIFPVFSEFGSELVSVLYCIPNFLRTQYAGYYSIAVGWSGRSFLYKNLVDEFWELDEQFAYLRDYCRAFHHDSKNLGRLERKLVKIGKFCHYNEFSRYVTNYLFKDVKSHKDTAHWPPAPAQDKVEAVKKYIRPNSVGICARNRITYGRNLSIGFYKQLIKNLEGMGYNPVWIGEKVTTYECPFDHIQNYRDSDDAKDLEKTLALVSQMDFTIQFWTASTRLAGLVGTPFIIFESPDQIWGIGQEGVRLNLCSKGLKKLVVCHFKNVEADHAGGLALVERAITEMNENNYSDIIGLVEDPVFVENLRKSNNVRIGSE